MEKTTIKGDEVVKYTVEEFIRATRPDGLGHIYFNGEHIAAFEEVICDACNANLVQPEDKPEEFVVFSLLDRAWCKKCFEEWAALLNAGREEA